MSDRDSPLLPLGVPASLYGCGKKREGDLCIRPPSGVSVRLYMSGKAREKAMSRARQYLRVREFQESSSDSLSQRFRWIIRCFWDICVNLNIKCDSCSMLSHHARLLLTQQLLFPAQTRNQLTHLLSKMYTP